MPTQADIDAENFRDFDDSDNIGSVVDKAQKKAVKIGRRGGFFKGLLVTTAAAAGFWMFAPQDWQIQDIKKYDYKDDISVSRVYRPGPDFVRVHYNNGETVSLNTYLRGIEEKADREVAKAEIRRLVDWYDGSSFFGSARSLIKKD